MFFGVSFVLAGVVRSTGAVIPPLIILFIALWLVRIPFAYAMVARWGSRCDLVELSARLAGVDAAVDRVLPLGRLAQGKNVVHGDGTGGKPHRQPHACSQYRRNQR